MKCEVVKIGKYANLEIHKNGRKNVPHHIKVVARKVKDDKGNFVVYAELENAPKEIELVTPKAETKKEVKQEPKKETKTEKFEEEKKKTLEHPDKKKPLKGREDQKKDNPDEEEMQRKKDVPHRSDKKTPIKN